MVDSICYFHERILILMMKLVLPINVFPVPGGPKSKIPFGGARRPVKMSGLSNGNTTISLTVFFT